MSRWAQRSWGVWLTPLLVLALATCPSLAGQAGGAGDNIQKIYLRLRSELITGGLPVAGAGGLSLAVANRDPAPEPGAEALQSEPGGNVIVRVRILKDGSVADPVLVHGDPGPRLAQAALDAARKWRFRPVTAGIDGPPVEALELLLFPYPRQAELPVASGGGEVPPPPADDQQPTRQVAEVLAMLDGQIRELAGRGTVNLEKARARGRDVEEPSVVLHLQPRYPLRPRRRGISARVGLILLIDLEGKVGDVTVSYSSVQEMGFEEAAEEAARQWIYRPALVNDKPVAAYHPVVITFDVRQKAGRIFVP